MYKLPDPVSVIKELFPLCFISKSFPVPNFAFTLSAKLTSPVKVAPVREANPLPAVTPASQAEPV